uniref:Uncharacterized protein n=1 Tax=viral metagenome TaxID=1070528 RepID=A0A6H1Z7M0_9ZZZZ
MVMNGDGHQKEPLECHDKCPECGSERGLVSEYVAELKEQGTISQDSFPAGLGVLELPFMDVKKLTALQLPGTIRPFPVMRVLWDVCGECFKLYVRRIEYTQRAVMQQPTASQLSHLPPG